MKPTLVPTGIKAYMGEDEFLQIVCIDGSIQIMPFSFNFDVRFIDSDYYNNEANEGFPNLIE
ncbi:hypothetical protein EfmAA290_27350 [Enterococcus faecium]|nr:hypothetical protein EfmAA290_27350 [Enterococcus faecium]